MQIHQAGVKTDSSADLNNYIPGSKGSIVEDPRQSRSDIHNLQTSNDSFKNVIHNNVKILEINEQVLA